MQRVIRNCCKHQAQQEPGWRRNRTSMFSLACDLQKTRLRRSSSGEQLSSRYGVKPAAWWLTLMTSTPPSAAHTSTRTSIVTPRSLHSSPLLATPSAMQCTARTTNRAWVRARSALDAPSTKALACGCPASDLTPSNKSSGGYVKNEADANALPVVMKAC